MISRRSGFTLMEILIVIVITVLLMGLLIPAVTKAISTANRVANASDMHQLDVALANFKSLTGFHPPSYFRVYNDYPDSRYATDGIDQESGAIASKLFGQTTGLNWMDPTNPNTIPNGYCSPLVSGPLPLPFWNLQGDQCLVFFLGGRPIGNTGQTSDIPGTNGFDFPRFRHSSFFEFKANRLVLRTRNGFFSYLDVYGESDKHGNTLNSDPTKSNFQVDHGKPYVYFASWGGMKDNYRISHAVDFPVSSTTTKVVMPYYLEVSSKRFHQSHTYQLLSAGKDRKFGNWIQWYVDNPYPLDTEGWDDQVNFHDRPLGTR